MKKLKTLICILFSVLLISGMFTSCNGDATSSLVNNSVTTVISMSVDKSIAQELSDSSKLNWFIMGTKPGSDENDKLLEVVEPFSADNPTFSKEIEVVAETPVVFGILAGDKWLADNENQIIPVQWQITGHKINGSGTENCMVSKRTETYVVQKMVLDPRDLRMTDEVKSETEESKDYFILTPIVKTIGHSSVKPYVENGSRGSTEEKEVIKVPEERILVGGEALLNALKEPSSSLAADNVDRFNNVNWDKIVIVDSSTDLIEEAKANKFLVIPGKEIARFVDAISPEKLSVWMPYLTENISESIAENVYLYFAMYDPNPDDDDEACNTYFSYSDFTNWADGKPWKQVLADTSDEYLKNSVIIEFQNEPDS